MKIMMVQALAFTRYVWVRFLRNQGMANAASLTFSTLLSLVPLMAVSLAVLSLLSISEQMYDEIQIFVFENFVPAAGNVLQRYLWQFSSKAAQLTGPGFLFLLVIALMMMASIDRAFNNIWQVKRKRSPLSLFVVYWAILSLGPLLISSSVMVSSYLISMPLFSGVAVDPMFSSKLLAFAPLIASTAAFSLLYLLVPNRRVPLKMALFGGLLAALLFELTKRGFALYVIQFPTYEAIYGALSVVPIFLIWVYLSWVITLLGAEFTFCLEHFEQENMGKEVPSADRVAFYFRILRCLWVNKHESRVTTLEQLRVDLPGVSEGSIEAELEVLQQQQWVISSASGGWLLCHDLSQTTVWDLLRLTESRVFETSVLLASSDALERELGLLLDKSSYELKRLTAIPLDQYFPAIPGASLV